MNKQWLILKSNYIIDKVVWDGVSPWEYPFPYDNMIEDTNGAPGIGDWYESNENVFYRPLSKPPDYPLK